MSDKKVSGSSILAQNLNKLYDSEDEKENFILRESKDVFQFLKEKEGWEKKSSEVQILFK